MSRRRDWVVTLVLGLGFGCLYLLTLCPTVFWYDSAEYVTAPVTLGIPHPPGYPLYTLLGHLFTWLPLPPAVAVNAMSAVFAAIAVALAYRIGRAIDAGMAAAATGAITLGASPLFWQNAIVAEVYCPAIAVIALITLMLLRARASGHVKWAWGAAGIAGLGLGIHYSIATCGLGFAWWVWAQDGRGPYPQDLRTLLTPSTFAARMKRCLVALGCTVLGSLVFLYLPLRASMKPVLNFGDPSSFHRFIWHVTGGNYKHWFGEVDVIDRLRHLAESFHQQISTLGMVLAAVGTIGLFRRRRVDAIALCLMVLGNVVFFFNYQVHDLDVFFLPTTLVMAIFAGVGAQVSIDAVARVVSTNKSAIIIGLTRTGVLAGSIALVFGHYRAIDMSDFDDTEKFIADAERTLPHGAVLMNFTSPPEWKMDAVFGMYAQKVLHLRTDVTIVENPAPRLLSAAHARGQAVYTYVPLDFLLHTFDMVPDGPFFRIVGPR